MPYVIDLFELEEAEGGEHWLRQFERERDAKLRASIREKHREKHRERYRSNRLRRSVGGVKFGDYDPNQPRAPAGTDIGGQWVPAGGGGASTVSTGRSTDITKPMAYETEDKKQLRQEYDDLDELYEAAKAAEPEFKEALEDFAADTDGKVVWTPEEHAEPGTRLKSRASAQRKLDTELEGEVAELKDVMRATVEYGRVVEARQGAAAFIERHGDAVVRVKDRFFDVDKTGGYRDILINIKTPGGVLAEVQFGTLNMLKAKFGDGHKLYEKMRAIVAERRTEKAIMDQLSDLNQQSVELYDKAYNDDGNGHGW